MKYRSFISRALAGLAAIPFVGKLLSLASHKDEKPDPFVSLIGAGRAVSVGELIWVEKKPYIVTHVHGSGGSYYIEAELRGGSGVAQRFLQRGAV